MTQIFPPIPGSQLQGPVLETWEPQHKLIAAITNAVNAEVTTTTDHGYYTGMTVRLVVPDVYKMGNGMYVQTPIVVTGPTTFVTSVDTLGLDPFVTPVLAVAFTPAQVTPMNGIERNIGDVN